MPPHILEASHDSAHFAKEDSFWCCSQTCNGITELVARVHEGEVVQEVLAMIDARVGDEMVRKEDRWRLLGDGPHLCAGK